jgi:hypothetical protein
MPVRQSSTRAEPTGVPQSTRPGLLGERFSPFPPSHASITQGPVHLSTPGIAHLCVEHVFGQILLSKHLFSNRVPLDMPPLNHPDLCELPEMCIPFPATGGCAQVTTRLCYRQLGITNSLVPRSQS